jgi:2-(1,2-epoxy-1,2-dihydrophenyl)acetyl-CoA isomerase
MILGLIEMEKPTIAMINGDAVGGGFEFTLACDLRVASEQARVGVGFTRIGLTPGQGMTWLLPRIVGLGRALEFILLANYWSAQDAYGIGLMNRVLPADKLESETMQIARRLADGPPLGLRLSKLQIYNGLRMDLDVALTFAGAGEYIALMSDDHLEGIQAFAEKRKPVYRDR